MEPEFPTYQADLGQFLWGPWKETVYFSWGWRALGGGAHLSIHFCLPEGEFPLKAKSFLLVFYYSLGIGQHCDVF